MFVCCAGAARQCSKASRTVVSGYMHVNSYLAPLHRFMLGLCHWLNGSQRMTLCGVLEIRKGRLSLYLKCTKKKMAALLLKDNKLNIQY